MLGTIKTEVQVGDKTVSFHSGLLAKLAHGSVAMQVGDTVVLSATTISNKPRPGIDWFPLQVEYREKFYAAGRFPGGFFKREARPSEFEILTARVTDRPIRPLFPKGFINDVQIFNQLLSSDSQEIPDILCINSASASLTLTEAPFMGPIGAVRVGRVEGEFVLNPTHLEMENSDLNLIYVGTRDLPMMIEGDAKEVREADIIAAMKLAHESVVKLIDAQLELRRLAGLPDKVVEPPVLDASLFETAQQVIGADLEAAMDISGKQERQDRVREVKDKWAAHASEQDPDVDGNAVRDAFDQLETKVVRSNVLEKKKRIDGRAFDELRPLSGHVGVLPRTHGSSVFSRGETQALATVTLGTLSDSQSLDAIAGGAGEKRFMLHYNFPPFSVGEAGRIMGPGRREVGHGNLAERSLRQVMPEEYAYTVRVVSEILESNGSSSMASICSGTLALMDAGVPISKPVAGISIGLFTDDAGHGELVTDILGKEDHCGDMDFKVGGTRDGITGFQVDLKLRGLRWEFVEKAFEMARESRLKILDYMAGVIADPRDDVSEHAPRVHDMKIPADKIGALIGPGGKHIRAITETYSVQIDVEDDGSVHIFGMDRETMAGAINEISGLTAEAEIGKLYHGTVKGTKDFGVFVEILPGKEGLVHISELADFRVRTVEDICKVGDEMWVKCLDVDETGRIRLSRRAAMEEKGGGGEGEGGGSGGESSSDRGQDRGGRDRGGDRAERDSREPTRS
jgi:polyribonucleotide nucleotidyltransferase